MATVEQTRAGEVRGVERGNGNGFALGRLRHYIEEHPDAEFEKRETRHKVFKVLGVGALATALTGGLAWVAHNRAESESAHNERVQADLAQARSGLVIQERDKQTGEVKKTEVTLEMGNPNLIDPPGGKLIIESPDCQVHCFELPRAGNGNGNGGVEYAYLVQQRVDNQWKKLLMREGSVSLAERRFDVAGDSPLSKHDVVGMGKLPSQGEDVRDFLNKDLKLPDEAENAPADIAKWFRDVVLRKLRAAANGTLEQHQMGGFTLSVLPDGDILFEDQQSHLSVIMDGEGKNILRGSTKAGSLEVARGAGNALYEIVSNPEFFMLAQGLVRLQDENPQAADLAAEIEREHFSFEVPALKTDEFPDADRIPLLRSALMPMGKGYAYGVTFFPREVAQARAKKQGVIRNGIEHVVRSYASCEYLLHAPSDRNDCEYFIDHGHVGWITPRLLYPEHMKVESGTKKSILSDEGTVRLLSGVPRFNFDYDPIHLPTKYADGLGVSPGREVLAIRARIGGTFKPVYELDPEKFYPQLSSLIQLQNRLHPKQASAGSGN